MTDFQSFPFTEVPSVRNYVDAVPKLPLTLSLQKPLEVSALLDSGASINVLPYSVGLELGAIWDESLPSLGLGGGIAATESQGIIVTAQVGTFEPVQLIFAWSRTDKVPVILGRTNFFMAFDVCFYRSQMFFEVRPAIRS